MSARHVEGQVLLVALPFVFFCVAFIACWIWDEWDRDRKGGK